MTTKITFYDDTTNMMKHLLTVNLGLVKEGLSISASLLAAEFQKSFEDIESTNWNSNHKNGHRYLTFGEKKKRFGDMYYKETGNPMPGKGGILNLKNFIKFFTPKEITSLYAIVGGGFKGFNPVMWRDGLKVGFKPYISGVGQKTLDILNKIEYGEVRNLSPREQKLFYKSAKAGGIGGEEIKRVRYKARNFASRARSSGGRRALAKIKNLYEANLPKAVNNINRKYKAEVVRFG